MLWKTLGDILEEDFLDWCEKLKVKPDGRTMIEFLGANGYLKTKKTAKKFVEEGRLPEFRWSTMSVRQYPMREGFIPPAACIYYEKE